MKSPVALFAYRRPEHLRRVVESLKENSEASETDLFIYCDAARSSRDRANVEAVRAYAITVSGFRTITVIKRDKNYGLSKSITEGVTSLCNKYGRVAVVEDDVIVSKYFLKWVNAALNKYETDDRVISVGCYVYPSQGVIRENFFLGVTDCWGWAVWKRSWNHYEPDGAMLLNQLVQRHLNQRFDLDGSYPYTDMLRGQINGDNDSWAVRWYATAVLSGGLTIYPGVSMTTNIGFDGSGIHCGTDNSYEVSLSDRPINIDNIPVVESAEVRAAWSDFLKKISQAKSTEPLLSKLWRWAKKMLILGGSH